MRYAERALVWTVSALIVIAMVAGCASGKNMPGPATDLLAHAERLLERGKHRDAEAAFRSFLDQYPGDPAASRAQLGLARSIMGEKEWDRARAEFTSLIEKYPDSPAVEDARFFMGVAYARESLPPEMDQTLSHKALDEFDAYLGDFPAGRYRSEALAERSTIREKLAEKELRNGFLYLKMGFPEAAQAFFQTILDQYGDTARADNASFGLAEALYAEGKVSEAGVIYRRLLESETESGLKKNCERRLRELETRLGTSSSG